MSVYKETFATKTFLDIAFVEKSVNGYYKDKFDCWALKLFTIPIFCGSRVK